MGTNKLEKLNACRDAIYFSKQFKTPKEAWENCPRGDWMLWVASRLGIGKRILTLAKGKCAATVLHLMKDQRSKDAVKAAIDYGEGKINDEELKTAATAATDAAAAADAAADAAATAATDAAYAAHAAYAAAAAADAAYAVDAAHADKKNNQLLTANICREILTKEVLAAYKKFK